MTESISMQNIINKKKNIVSDNNKINFTDFFMWLDQEILNNQDINFTYNQDSITFNWDKINNKIREEIAANLYGKDYKYYVRICEDTYFLSALENLDQARALALLYNPHK